MRGCAGTATVHIRRYPPQQRLRCRLRQRQLPPGRVRVEPGPASGARMLPPISPPALSWLRSCANSDGHKTKSSCLCFSVQLTSSRSARGLALRRRLLIIDPPRLLTGAVLWQSACSWSRAVCRVIVTIGVAASKLQVRLACGVGACEARDAASCLVRTHRPSESAVQVDVNRVRSRSMLYPAENTSNEPHVCG
jgi:hypothetical protein